MPSSGCLRGHGCGQRLVVGAVVVGAVVVGAVVVGGGVAGRWSSGRWSSGSMARMVQQVNLAVLDSRPRCPGPPG